jgi:hypothetical protein
LKVPSSSLSPFTSSSSVFSPPSSLLLRPLSSPPSFLLFLLLPPPSSFFSSLLPPPSSFFSSLPLLFLFVISIFPYKYIQMLDRIEVGKYADTYLQYMNVIMPLCNRQKLTCPSSIAQQIQAYPSSPTLPRFSHSSALLPLFRASPTIPRFSHSSALLPLFRASPTLPRFFHSSRFSRSSTRLYFPFFYFFDMLCT